MCAISLNLKENPKKRKKQGFGLYHLQKRSATEFTIMDFLDFFENRRSTKPIVPSFANVRMISDYTRLHHSTIRKAIDRLKEKNEILEVYGKKKARLFTLYDSKTAQQIREEIKNDSKYGQWLNEINSKKVLQEPQRDEEGFAYPILYKEKAYVKRLRKKYRQSLKKNNKK